MVKKNIGIIGLGNHAIKRIIPSIVRSSNLEFLGCFTRNKENLKEISEELNIIAWSSFHEMLSNPDLDVIYLSTPPGTHYEFGKKILESGKHLWCEKPLTVNHQHTVELIELSRNLRLSIFECFMYRFHPHFKLVKDIVTNEKFGKAKTVSIKFGLPPMEDPGFRLNPDLGGSCLYDVGSYLFSALIDLFPNLEPEVIFSKIENDPINKIDESGISLIKFNKTNCFLEWAYNRSYQNNIEIWFEDGSLFTNKIFSKPDDYRPKLITKDKFGKSSIVEIDNPNHFDLMLEYFFNSIEDSALIDNERNRIHRLSSILDEVPV